MMWGIERDKQDKLENANNQALLKHFLRKKTHCN